MSFCWGGETQFLGQKKREFEVIFGSKQVSLGHFRVKNVILGQFRVRKRHFRSFSVIFGHFREIFAEPPFTVSAVAKNLDLDSVREGVFKFVLPQYAYAHSFVIEDENGESFESQIIHAKDGGESGKNAENGENGKNGDTSSQNGANGSNSSENGAKSTKNSAKDTKSENQIFDQKPQSQKILATLETEPHHAQAMPLVKLKFSNPNIISKKSNENLATATLVKPAADRTYQTNSRNVSVHSNGQYFLVKVNIPPNSFVKFTLVYQELLNRYRGFYRYSAAFLENYDSIKRKTVEISITDDLPISDVEVLPRYSDHIQNSVQKIYSYDHKIAKIWYNLDEDSISEAFVNGRIPWIGVDYDTISVGDSDDSICQTTTETAMETTGGVFLECRV